MSSSPFRHVTQPVQPKPSKLRASSKHTVSEPSYPVKFPICPVPQNLQIPSSQQTLIPNPQDIVLKKYATSVDERNFLTVYEFMVNGQWIIWDYFTGYVHLTGLWKAIGHSKADIVKLVDNSPDLEPVIRRVRGGFLKIQGTWVPFDIARALAARTCYFIRYALIPVFGESFPDSCLQPHEPGFGQLQLTLVDPKRRKKRSSVGGVVQRQQQQQHQQQFQQGMMIDDDTLIGSMRKRRKSEVASPKSFPNIFPASISSSAVNSPAMATSPTFYGLAPSIPIPQPRHPSIASTLLSSPPRGGYHRHSRSLGGSDSSIFDRIHNNNSPRFFDVPRSRRDTTGSLSSSRSDVQSSEWTVLSSSSDDDEPLDAYSIDKRTRRLSYPPPMPGKIVFPDEDSLVRTPDEFLEVLQATRSLQQISAGASGRGWSFGGNLGGGFECGGKVWQWDGKKDLNIVGLSPSPPSVSPAVVSSAGFAASSAAVLSNPTKPPMEVPIPATTTQMNDSRVPSSSSRGVMDISGLLS
jgi:hypothetical protein